MMLFLCKEILFHVILYYVVNCIVFYLL